MRRRIRTLLVINHELIRKGLRRMLESEEDMEVVGECANAEEALSQIGSLSPDIVLIDVRMPGMSGIEATRRLKGTKLNCGANIIILADCADYMMKALEVGADGYILKDTKCEDLIHAVRQVYHSTHSAEEETVDLIMPPPVNAVQTLGFIKQVESELGGSVTQTVGSWDWGTIITITLKPELISDLVGKLRNIPHVEEVEEESLASDGSLSFLKKLPSLSKSRINSRKKIFVTMS